MTPAKHLKASLCFTTIQPSLRALWTKPRWHVVKPVRPRKQTASRTSCANVIRITSAGEPFKMCVRQRVILKSSPESLIYKVAASIISRLITVRRSHAVMSPNEAIQQSSTHDEVHPRRPDQQVNRQECEGD